jgi:hypothetical protein
MRQRLRSTYEDFALKQIYQIPHNHLQFADHIIRVNTSIDLLNEFGTYESIADLSAGDATIIKSLESDKKYIGDFAPGYEITGAIETTINQIPKVDLFICSETLEHLDNPDAVLAAIREKTNYLFVSTPNGESNTLNPEHYWGWDSEDMKEMLIKAGFEPQIFHLLKFENYDYDYQMWVCK